MAAPVCFVVGARPNFMKAAPVIDALRKRGTGVYPVHTASLLLAHSPGAVETLEREGLDPKLVHLVGNTMIDSLFTHLEAARAAAPWVSHGLDEGTYGIVTLHRPALVDDPVLLRETLEQLVALTATTQILFAAHPRTIERLATLGLDLSGLSVTGPLGYLEFLGLEAA